MNAKINATDCDHTWRYYSTSSTTTWLRCTKCQWKTNRPSTPAERKRFKAKVKRYEARAQAMHGIGWNFRKHFCDKGTLRYRGFDLIKRMEKWAAKYPKDVLHSGCDDDLHCGSDIWYILHRVKRRNWGTTVVVVPEYGTPTIVFLYPGHAKDMLRVLETITKFKPL